MKTIALVLGTRPEVIKLAPVIRELEQHPTLRPYVIASGQHREMADTAFSVFGISPDVNLELMEENQSPNSFLAALLPKLSTVLEETKPVGVIVQGDTTTTLGSALAAFHLQIPVAHVEAGLRTHDLKNPFPEEMNRTLVSRIASAHFAPTEQARKNLEREGVTEKIYVTGNTVVDALSWFSDKLTGSELEIDSKVTRLMADRRKLVLVTGHRRENFDVNLKNLCSQLKRLVEDQTDIQVAFPVHLNPNVKSVVEAELADKERIHLLSPLDYPSLLSLIKHSSLIISDSGGIQEEAPSFGSFVLVTRKLTERPEVLETGHAKLVSLENEDELFEAARTQVLSQSREANTPADNPFGDGRAAQRIVEILSASWGGA